MNEKNYIDILIKNNNLHDSNLTGTSFENENYSGYNLSYLVIRYLSETLNENEFYKLLLNINKLKEIGLTAIMICLIIMMKK